MSGGPVPEKRPSCTWIILDIYFESRGVFGEHTSSPDREIKFKFGLETTLKKRGIFLLKVKT